jgi:hypothetical protein
MSMIDAIPLGPWGTLPLVVLILYVLINFTSSTSKNADLPNGPRPLPFLGNIPHIAALHLYPGILCKKYASSYKHMVTLWLGQSRIIMIHSPKVAYELMQKV